MRDVKAIILLAHEDPLQHHLIDMLLSPGGFKVVAYSEAKGALTFLRDHTPDAAIVSATLPQLDGIGICAKMKSIRRLQPVPVVLTMPPRQDPAAKRLGRRIRYAAPDLLLHLPLGDKNLRERVERLLAAPKHEAAADKSTLLIEQAIDSLQPLSVEALSARIQALEEENRQLRLRLESHDTSAEVAALRKLSAEQAQRISRLEGQLKASRRPAGPLGLFGRRRA